MGESTKLSSFTKLLCWRKGHLLVVEIYKLTSQFPKYESYSLIDQMRRASVSITSNIAEGFNRHGIKEKIQFYYMALGSLSELQNQIFIAYDLTYIDSLTFNNIAGRTVIVSKLLNGLIKSIRSHLH